MAPSRRIDGDARPYRRRVSTDAQTGERVWAIVYVAVLLDRQNNGPLGIATVYREAEEEADRARAEWFKRVNGGLNHGARP
jgi:hypothetical protein